MQVNVKWRHDRQFRAKLGQIQKRLGDTRPVMKSLAITVHKWILENYRSSGGKLKGRKWAPLRPSTKAGRRKGSDKPLQDTGHMMRQWNWFVTRLKAIIGNPMEITRYHEEGTGIYGPERKRYLIKPVRKKALAFPVSGYTVGKHGAAKRKSRLNMAVVKYVVHPGIRQRRQLPMENEILPELMQVADIWLKKVSQ